MWVIFLSTLYPETEDLLVASNEIVLVKWIFIILEEVTMILNWYFNVLLHIYVLIWIFIYLKLKAEISRCEKLKFDNIQRFVEGMRKEIVEWWDKCFYSREQREQFTSYFNGKTKQNCH